MRISVVHSCSCGQRLVPTETCEANPPHISLEANQGTTAPAGGNEATLLAPPTKGLAATPRFVVLVGVQAMALD